MLLIGPPIRFDLLGKSKLITKQSLQKVPDSDSDRPAVQVGFPNGAVEYCDFIGPFRNKHQFETHSKPSYENIRSTIISCFDYVIEAAQGLPKIETILFNFEDLESSTLKSVRNQEDWVLEIIKVGLTIIWGHLWS